MRDQGAPCHAKSFADTQRSFTNTQCSKSQANPMIKHCQAWSSGCRHRDCEQTAVESLRKLANEDESNNRYRKTWENL